MIRNISINIRQKRVTYLQSEAYYFKQLTQALNQKNPQEFIRDLYIWFDRVRRTKQNAAIYYFLDSEEKALLESIIQNKDSNINVGQKKKLNALLPKLRNRILFPELVKTNKYLINPV